MKSNSNTEQNDNQIYSLIAKNTYQTRSPHILATGFRTAALQYEEREKLPNCAETFLVNSFLKRNDPEIETSIASYLSDEGIKLISLSGREEVVATELIDLGVGASLDISLGHVLGKRRSSRDFTGDPLSFDSLVTLIRATAGVSAIADTTLSNGESVQFQLRTVPSGGGLYPVELYIAVLNTKKLKKGIYRYLPVLDKLTEFGQLTELNQLLQSFSGAVDLVKSSNASAVFLFIAKPWRSMRKYGHRGLRFVFQEVGGMAQNLHLVVAGLGLGSVDCASFYEDEAHRALKIDGVFQTLIHATLVGVSA